MSGTDQYKQSVNDVISKLQYTFINVRNLCFPVFCFDGRTIVFLRELFVAMNKLAATQFISVLPFGCVGSLNIQYHVFQVRCPNSCERSFLRLMYYKVARGFEDSGHFFLLQKTILHFERFNSNAYNLFHKLINFKIRVLRIRVDTFNFVFFIQALRFP